jgi:hypothetical protein
MKTRDHFPEGPISVLSTESLPEAKESPWATRYAAVVQLMAPTEEGGYEIHRLWLDEAEIEKLSKDLGNR